MVYGYVRVYERIKDLDYQVDALLKYGIKKENIITDSEFKDLNNIYQRLNDGDTLVIWKTSRFATSLNDFINVLNEFITKGIKFKSLSEPIIDTTNSVIQSGLLIKIIPFLVKFEKGILSEKISTGIELARENGKIIGHPIGLSKKAKEKAKLVSKLYTENNFTIKEICDIVGISKGTYYKYLRSEGMIKSQ